MKFVTSYSCQVTRLFKELRFYFPSRNFSLGVCKLDKFSLPKILIRFFVLNNFVTFLFSFSKFVIRVYCLYFLWWKSDLWTVSWSGTDRRSQEYIFFKDFISIFQLSILCRFSKFMDNSLHLKGSIFGLSQNIIRILFVSFSFF